jgi:hypothetical protein
MIRGRFEVLSWVVAEHRPAAARVAPETPASMPGRRGGIFFPHGHQAWRWTVGGRAGGKEVSGQAERRVLVDRLRHAFSVIRTRRVNSYDSYVSVEPPNVLVAPYHAEDEARVRRLDAFLPAAELRAEVEHWERTVEYHRREDALDRRSIELDDLANRPKRKRRDKRHKRWREIAKGALSLVDKPRRGEKFNTDFAAAMLKAARREPDEAKKVALLKEYGQPRSLAGIIGVLRPWLDVAWTRLQAVPPDEREDVLAPLADCIVSRSSSASPTSAEDRWGMPRRRGRGRPRANERMALAPTVSSAFNVEIDTILKSRKRASPI